MSTYQTLIEDLAHLVGISGSPLSVNHPDKTVNVLSALITSAGNDIMRYFEWRDLMRVGIGNTPIDFAVGKRGGVFRLPIPVDFHRLAGRGTNVYNYLLVTNDDAWNTLARPDDNPAQHTYFRLRKGHVELIYGAFAYDHNRHPDYDHLVNPKLRPPQIDYISKFWVNGDKRIPNAPDDTFGIPYDLLLKSVVWRYYRRNGIAYEDYYNEYHSTFKIESFASRGFEGTPQELETNVGS